MGKKKAVADKLSSGLSLGQAVQEGHFEKPKASLGQKLLKGVTFVVLFLFVLSLSGFLLVFSAESVLLNPESLFSVFDEAGIIDEFYSNPNSSLSRALPGEAAGVLTNFKESVSLQELKALLKSTLTDFLDYFNSKREDIPKIKFPAFGSLKAPFTYDITVLVGKKNFEDIREIVSLVALVRTALLAVSVFLLALLIVLARPLVRIFKYLAFAFIVSGVLVMIFSFAISNSPRTILGSLHTLVPAEFSALVQAVIVGLTTALFNQLLLYGAAVTAVGIVFLVLFFVKRKKK